MNTTEKATKKRRGGMISFFKMGSMSIFCLTVANLMEERAKDKRGGYFGFQISDFTFEGIQKLFFEWRNQ
jgi:hypothetical protein